MKSHKESVSTLVQSVAAAMPYNVAYHIGYSAI